MAKKASHEVFMWAAYNAYVLMGHYKPYMQPGHRDCTFHMFLEKLCNELVGDFQTKTENRQFSGATIAVFTCVLVNQN